MFLAVRAAVPGDAEGSTLQDAEPEAERDVQVVNLCVRETLEDHLLEVLDDKLNMFELVVGELDMVLGDIQSDLDLPTRVFAIWAEASGLAEVRAGFTRLAEELQAARAHYEDSRAADEAIFGRDFEAT